MKTLQFDELSLLSRTERAALRVPLHPRSTVIKGENDTGKSSIVKSLYATLGADPPVIHTRWAEAGVISSLIFRVDNTRYRMIRAGSRYSLYDAEDELIGSYTSVTHELAPAISELFSFRLLLKSKRDEADVQATPAFLFLPFYIDQDAGWYDTLNSFSRLQQFRSPKLDVINFHFGIRPSEYYSAKARYTFAESQAQPLRQERATLERVMSQLEQELKVADFSIDLDAFRDEVAALLDRCRRLRKEEEQLRARMTSAYNVLSATNEQIEITKRALRELQEDRAYAASLEGESVKCPTCHAEYANGFAERFLIAVDEDRCITLLNELEEERAAAANEYEKAREATSQAQRMVAEIEGILSSKREELVFADIVRSEGRREMRRVAKSQIEELNKKIGDLDADREQARAEMRRYEDKKRTRSIKEYFLGEFSRLLMRLDVQNTSAEAFKRLDAKIRETGSDRPRAILAYYLASIKTIAKHSTCAMCPLVIDSPRQQDQDDTSWNRIREVIQDERPPESQLILALADDGETDFGGDVRELTQKNAVLRSDQYEDLREEIMPLVGKAFEKEAE